MKGDELIEKECRIVLFDGVCHLCQGAVTFIIDRDPSGRFAFAPLQSVTAARLMGRALEEGEEPSSIILIENGTCYTQSAAALRISRQLSFPWPALYIFILLPSPIRDALYRFVAARRYRWFGKDTVCMMPSPKIRSRFIEEYDEDEADM